MDANSGAPWSEADISDLKNELDHGRTIAETAASCAGTKTRCGRRRESLG
jgi:hypothetical protein